MKAMKAAAKASTKKPAGTGDEKKDDAKKNHDDKTKDSAVPEWAVAPFRQGSDVEIAHLEGTRWIASEGVHESTSIREVLERSEHPGCSEGYKYRAIGVAVCLLKTRDDDDDDRKKDDDKGEDKMPDDDEGTS